MKSYDRNPSNNKKELSAKKEASPAKWQKKKPEPLVKKQSKKLEKDTIKEVTEDLEQTHKKTE